ncbi:multicopper oxidase family protein [Fluviispira multicolorata]|uniref:Multicopper oxidase domain-containing protein n=1 Tax=Fluviispira multicolorata TaxID=2654512 RepID=A0A833N816_9BACT|nr:multicopper oxidase family protein [Fluviispira multicolorata]KAB8033536.1 multicopper oxidase domain-containing protein [Fluviispira multicolorata]
MNELNFKKAVFLLSFLIVNPVFSEKTHDHHENSSLLNKSDNEEFSKSTEGLPFVKKTESIQLKDGQNFTLIASEVKQKIGGKIIKRYAYNGSIPGPILEIQKGAKINIKFINKTETDQTLHSHGLRLDYRFDGAVGLGQKAPVKPGESFDYKLTFPDAGVYWYHPHIREDYSQNMGLYGNFIVKQESEKRILQVNKIIPLMLSDYLLDPKAQPFYKNRANYAAMGRFGNILLINGVDNYKEKINEGDVIRFYLTNTANTRTFNFKIPNAKIKLVAADASPYVQQQWIDNITISPSERYTIDVLFKNKGTYNIQNSTPEKSQNFGIIIVGNNKSEISYEKNFLQLKENKELKNEISSISKYFDKKVDKQLKISVDMKMDHSGHGENPEIEWEDNMPTMNSFMTSKDVTWQLIDLETNKINMDVNWIFKKGQYYKIRIFNDPNSKHPMQHPIHFHGQKFLVLSDNNVKNPNLAWKDTFLVKTGHTVDILLEASNIGKWMAHCHIAEHLTAAMMIGFKVEN